MSTRPVVERVNTLEDVLKKLGDPNKIGKNMSWVAKDYSIKDLILDLQQIASVYPLATNE